MFILSDEIYSEFTFDFKHSSISEFYPERTFVTNGISKWAGAGGWRLGYLVVPKEYIEFAKVLNNFHSETFSAVSAPI